MKHVFIGFHGWPNDTPNQNERTLQISEGFEFWNLKQFSLAELLAEVKNKIPSINDNVLKNYTASEDNNYGITEKQLKQCNWGLLLPTYNNESESYTEIISVLNLYSPSFMRPAFYVSDFGVRVINRIPEAQWSSLHNSGNSFKSENFIAFYKAMLPQMKYFRWHRDDALSWGEEDWRLFMASSFYADLERYENSKTIFTWQKESADMATLLETLFTAGDSEKDDIGYRLRKRVFVLIGWKFPIIQKAIKELYSNRSEFVHGSYYKKIIKEMRRNKDNDPAMPRPADFNNLYEMKEYVRFSLAAYLYLHAKKSTDQGKIFNSFKNVQELLEAAVLNMELRHNIIEIIKPLIDLLPKSE